MNLRREPIAIINGLTALAEAAIAILVGFGLDWTAEQVALVMALVVAVANIAKTLYGRSQVTPLNDPRTNNGTPLIPTEYEL